MARKKKMTRTVTIYMYNGKAVNMKTDEVVPFTYSTHVNYGNNIVQGLKKDFADTLEYEHLIPFSAALENTEECKYWMYEEDFIEHANITFNEKE